MWYNHHIDQQQRDKMKTAKQLAVLLVETATFKIVDTFTDDHIVCVNVTINGLPATFWYFGWEGIGALKYLSTSIEAKKDLVPFIEYVISSTSEGILEGDSAVEVNALALGLDKFTDEQLETLIA
jgi:hypothetical protein